MMTRLSDFIEAGPIISLPFAENWDALINTPLFLITLTLLAYQCGLSIYKISGNFSLLHPLLISSMVMVVSIHALKIRYEDYFVKTNMLYFLLGPTTVALAVPMHQYFFQIRKFALPILVTLIVGSTSAFASALLIAKYFGANETVIFSLAPKSVTTPIALNIVQIIGGSPSLTAGVVVATGIIGAIVAPFIFKLLKIDDPKVQGFTLGLTAHAVGTAKAFDISGEAGAFASLALSLTGIFTVFLLPFVIHFFV